MEPDPVKLRKINAEMGRWVLLKRPGGVVVHRATIVPVYPKGRQVYPHLDYDLHCGGSSDRTREVEGSVLDNALVTCEGCRTKQWNGVIQSQARVKAIRVEIYRQQGHMLGFTTEPRT
jgi:hypothetical protein